MDESGGSLRAGSTDPAADGADRGPAGPAIKLGNFTYFFQTLLTPRAAVNGSDARSRAVRELTLRQICPFVRPPTPNMATLERQSGS
ncbi:hypothetical protein GCM10009665_46960 [Kitasatospora nipponensis]|uniref:Uncharacterized protein n=1 Tax=Kitasatospora nipponensis TaxID=258049 RepID=A0ABP4H868_9ACTN